MTAHSYLMPHPQRTDRQLCFVYSSPTLCHQHSYKNCVSPYDCWNSSSEHEKQHFGTAIQNMDSVVGRIRVRSFNSKAGEPRKS